MSHAHTNANASETRTHWYPGTVAEVRPTAWWYWGRAVYVSRRDYWRITKYFLAVGIPLGAIGVLFHVPMAFKAAMLLAAIGLVLLAYSLFGLYRMYGHPGVRYIRRLVELGEVKGPVTVADLNIGTYRHAFLLSDVLPEAKIQSVDCWNVEGESPEEAVQDVRDLEAAADIQSRESLRRRRIISRFRWRIARAKPFALDSARTKFPPVVHAKNSLAKRFES